MASTVDSLAPILDVTPSMVDGVASTVDLAASIVDGARAVVLDVASRKFQLSPWVYATTSTADGARAVVLHVASRKFQPPSWVDATPSTADGVRAVVLTARSADLQRAETPDHATPLIPLTPSTASDVSPPVAPDGSTIPPSPDSRLAPSPLGIPRPASRDRGKRSGSVSKGDVEMREIGGMSSVSCLQTTFFPSAIP